MAKEILELSNKFVRNLEDENLARLHRTIRSTLNNPILFKIVEGQLNEELNRLYVKDEDEEENWIDNQEYRKWFKNDE